ncbi:uncharacterized protein [Chiloscyllium punctatum]|uniref:uncharacterized protein isoform X1 n=1 Tax=Chiloscyllium punctatum TaxID=137246 RepID=UPI003B63D1BB
MDNQQSHVGSFQHGTPEHKESATDGQKKIKRNHKVTFLKYPQRKIHKKVKHHGSSEPIYVDTTNKDIGNTYENLPIAPPLPEHAFWKHSSTSERSVTGHHSLPYLIDPVKNSGNTGLTSSKANNMKEYSEQLEILHASEYLGQMSKSEQATTETSSPIMININSYSNHSHLSPSQDNDIQTRGNLVGLTVNQTDCTYGFSSIAPPLAYADNSVNRTPTSPIQMLHLDADSIEGTSSLPQQSPCTQVSNQPDAFIYSIQSENARDDNVLGMVRSSNQIRPSHNVSHTSGHFVQSLPSQATDKTQGMAWLPIWSQVTYGEQRIAQGEGTHSHNGGDREKPIKTPRTKFFHPTDSMGEVSLQSGSVHHRNNRHKRDRKAKSVSQQESCLYLPKPCLKETIKDSYCFSTSSKLDSNKPNILTSPIQRPDVSADNEQSLHYFPTQFPYTNLKGHTGQENISSLKSNSQHQKSTKIPVTQIFHAHDNRPSSYNDPLSVNQRADRYRTRRSRSISPQKSHYYSLLSNPNAHIMSPYCYSEALTHDHDKDAINNQVADNVQHESKFPIKPLSINVVDGQWISNPFTPIKHNVQSTSNSSFGSVFCGIDNKKQDSCERMSGSSIRSSTTHDNSSAHQIFNSSYNSPFPVDVNTRNAFDFSTYSLYPFLTNSMNCKSQIHFQSTGMNNTSNNSLCSQHRWTQRAVSSQTKSLSSEVNNTTRAISPTKSLSSQVNDRTRASSPTKTLSHHANTKVCVDNARDVSNFRKLAVTPADINIQTISYSSNQSLPLHNSDNEKSAFHVSVRSLPIHVGDKSHNAPFSSYLNNVGDNAHESIIQSNNIQHIHTSSPQSSTEIDNSHHTLHTSRPSISSNFDSYVENVSTYSPDHALNIKTVSHPSPNTEPILVNTNKEHLYNFSDKTPLTKVDDELKDTSKLLTKTSATHIEGNVIENTHSFIQSLHLQVDGETQDMLHPPSQSPTSQIDSYKQNASNSVTYSFTSNSDNQLPKVQSTQIDSMAQNVSNMSIQSLAIHADDCGQAISHSLPQKTSTNIGENGLGGLQTFRSSNSSVQSHSIPDSEQNIPSSSTQTLSTCVKSNAVHKSRSSSKSLSVYGHDECITCTASTLPTAVMHNAQGMHSPSRPLLIPVQNKISPIHPLHTSVNQSGRSASHPSCKVSTRHIVKNVQDASASFTQVSTYDNGRDAVSLTSLPTQNTKDVTQSPTQSFPNSSENRQRILHEVSPPVNSPPAHNGCTTAYSICAPSTFSNNTLSKTPTKSPSTSTAQQVASSSPKQSQYTDPRKVSIHSTSTTILNPTHYNIHDTYNSSMQSTNDDPNAQSQSSPSTLSLPSFTDNVQCLPSAVNQILGIPDHIQDISTSFTPSTCGGNKQTACLTSKSHLNPGNTNNDEDKQDTLCKWRQSIHSSSPHALDDGGTVSSSSVGSLWSKTEKNERSATSPSINTPSGFAHHTEKCVSDSTSLQSKMEEPQQTIFYTCNQSSTNFVRDNILHSHKSCPKSPFTFISDDQQIPSTSASQSASAHLACNAQASSSSIRPLLNPERKDVYIVSHSSTSQHAFKPYIHSPSSQALLDNTLDTKTSQFKSLSADVNDQTVFCSSAQSAYTNSKTQDAANYPQSLSTNVDNNLQSFSTPSSELLHKHKNRTANISSTQSQSTPISNKSQTISHKHSHSKSYPVSNHLHGGCSSSTHSTSNPVTNRLQGGCSSCTHSTANSNNSDLYDNRSSSIPSRSSPADNNLHSNFNPCTSSKSSPDGNNLHSSLHSPSHSKSSPIYHNLHSDFNMSTHSKSSPAHASLHNDSISSTHSKCSPNNNNNLYSGSSLSNHSKFSPISHNPHDGTYSPTQSQSSPFCNNRQTYPNSPIQSWSSSVSNNFQGGFYSPTEPWLNTNLVSNNPRDISCSYTPTQSRSSGNNSQITPSPSTDVGHRSDMLRAFRSSKHSQSPHAFYSVIPTSSFPAYSSVSPVSDNSVHVHRVTPKSPIYVDNGQNITPSCTQLLSTHVPAKVPDASFLSTQSTHTHTEEIAQTSTESSKFSQVHQEVQGVHHAYRQAHSSSAEIKQDESDSSNQVESPHSKAESQVSWSSLASFWNRYCKDSVPNYSSPAPSSSIFPSSTSPDDSSGAWSSSTQSLWAMTNDLSSTPSSLIQSSSPKSDDSTSFTSGYTITSLYDE